MSSKPVMIKFEGEIRSNEENTKFIYHVEAFSPKTGLPLEPALTFGPFDTEEEAEIAGKEAISFILENIGDVLNQVTTGSDQEETVH